MRLATLVVTTVLAGGCTKSISERGDEALRKQQFVEAAELFDQALRKNPNDKHALAKRAEARNHALENLLSRTTRARVNRQSDEAMEALGELLVRRDTWGMTLDGQLAKSVTVEVVAAGNAIDASVTQTASSAGPLSAEQIAAHYGPLLAHKDFQTWRAEISDSVKTAGVAACTRLAPRATTPYFSWAVARFCKHFGGDDVTILPRSNLRTALVVDGSLGGIPPEDTARIRDTMAATFRESVWFSPEAARSAHANIGGRLAASFDAHTVSRTANWTEQVPYTDYVDEQESYQEPYDEQESYEEQVPHTEYHSCGDTTCPETVYSSETKYRTVTKYRTAYRTVTKPVTRYRDVPRSFTYEALERNGHYTSTLRLRLDRDSPDVIAELSGDFVEHGFDHDVSNAAAGVSPERANLPSLGEFTTREEARLRDALRGKLDARYAEQYCSAAKYDLETASACAYLAPANVPVAVHAAFRTAFGADELLLPTILQR